MISALAGLRMVPKNAYSTVMWSDIFYFFQFALAKQFLFLATEHWAARTTLWNTILSPGIAPGSLLHHLINKWSLNSLIWPLVYVIPLAAGKTVPMWSFTTALQQTLLCWNDFVTAQSCKTRFHVVARCLSSFIPVFHLIGDLKRNILYPRADQQQRHLYQVQHHIKLQHRIQ